MDVVLARVRVTIIHTPRVLHTTIDYLSRIETGKAATRVPNDISDGDILTQDAIEEIRINGRDTWYKEIEYNLTL